MSNDANRDIVTQLNLIRRLQKALNGSNEEEQTEEEYLQQLQREQGNDYIKPEWDTRPLHPDLTKDFRDLLEAHEREYDTIYIAAHSLGGLVTQKALFDAWLENNNGTNADYRFLSKVKKVILVGVPNDGSAFLEAYQAVYQFLVNKISKYNNMFNINGELVQYLKEGLSVPQVPGIDYYVVAGTNPYQFGSLLGAGQDDKAHDGLVTIESAQHVGDSYINDRCKDFWDINVTHTMLIENDLSRRLIEKVVAKEILKGGYTLALGNTKFFQARIEGCDSRNKYALIGKVLKPEEKYDPSGCSCGNKACGEGETELNCPADCFTGAPAGIDLKKAILILIIIAAAFFIYRRKKKKRGSHKLEYSRIPALFYFKGAFQHIGKAILLAFYRAISAYNFLSSSIKKRLHHFRIKHFLTLFGIPLIIISIIALLTLLFPPSYTGNVILTRETLTREKSITEEISFMLKENGTLPWIPETSGAITSVLVDAEFTRDADARLFLEGNGEKFLLLDTRSIIKKEKEDASLYPWDETAGDETGGIENRGDETGGIENRGDETGGGGTSDDEILPETLPETNGSAGQNKSILMQGEVPENSANRVIGNLHSSGSQKYSQAIGVDSIHEFSIGTDGMFIPQRLCTAWKVNGIPEACNGNSACCSFLGMEASGEWNSTFYVPYNRYSASLRNTVEAKLVSYYVNLSVPSSDIRAAAPLLFAADFLPPGISVERYCEETCSLPSLNASSYLLSWEVTRGNISLKEINYRISEIVEGENLPPKPTAAIPPFRMFSGEIKTLDLNSYFTDPENDKMVFNAYPANNITFYINGSIATIVPDNGFEGKAFSFFYASDGIYNGTSNVFEIEVKAALFGEPETGNLSSFKIQDEIQDEIQEKPKVRLNEPVKWVRKVNASKGIQQVVLPPAEAIINITVKDLDEGAYVLPTDISINDSGGKKDLASFALEKRLGKIVIAEEEMIQEKVRRVKENASDILFIESVNQRLLELENQKNSITGYAVAKREEGKGILTKFFEWLFNAEITGYAVLDNAGGSGIADSAILSFANPLNAVEIEYFTEGPTSFERNVSKSAKSITISSATHYEDIIAFSSLQREAPLGNIELFWLINGTRQRVSFEPFDTNNNSLVDYIEWVVPSLSNQTYELSLSIINVQSYPPLGGNWTVRFNVTGTANLTIAASNGTTYPEFFIDNVSTIQDILPIELRCNETRLWSRNETTADSSVLFVLGNGSEMDLGQAIGSSFNLTGIKAVNFSCNSTTYHTIVELTTGEHHQSFTFGNITAYAHNDVGPGCTGAPYSDGTGQACTTTGSCSGTSPCETYTDMPTCFAQSCTWTPGSDNTCIDMDSSYSLDSTDDCHVLSECSSHMGASCSYYNGFGHNTGVCADDGSGGVTCTSATVSSGEHGTGLTNGASADFHDGDENSSCYTSGYGEICSSSGGNNPSGDGVCASSGGSPSCITSASGAVSIGCRIGTACAVSDLGTTNVLNDCSNAGWACDSAQDGSGFSQDGICDSGAPGTCRTSDHLCNTTGSLQWGGCTGACAENDKCDATLTDGNFNPGYGTCVSQACTPVSNNEMYLPTDDDSNDYTIAGDSDGSLTNGSTHSTNQFVNFTDSTYGQRYRVKAMFGSGDVDFSNLTIWASDYKTAFNVTKQTTSIQNNHTIYIPATLGMGVYVCHGAHTLDQVDPDCSNKTVFTHAQATQANGYEDGNGYYVTNINGMYVLSNLKGSGGGQAVTDCGILNTSNTTYELANSISGGSTCITITGTNITLDCGQYSITYATVSQGYGITVSGYNYTTIRNCTIIESGGAVSSSYAIYIVNSSHGAIWNSTISTAGSSNVGIYGTTSSQNYSINTTRIETTGSGAYGLYLDSTSNYFTLKDSFITTTNGGAYGAYLYGVSNTTLENVNITTSGMTSYGVYLQTASPTVQTTNTSIIRSNITTTQQTGYGIYLQAGANNTYMLGHNITTSGVDAHGIFVSSSSYNEMRNNTLKTTDASASSIYIYQSSISNLMEKNRITSSAGDAFRLTYLSTDPGFPPENNNLTNNSMSNVLGYEVNTTVLTLPSSNAINRTYLIDQPIRNYSFSACDEWMGCMQGATFTFRSTAFGEIYYLGPINGTGTNLSQHIQIHNLSILVNDTVNDGTLNRTANLSLFNVGDRGISNPQLLRNGGTCDLTTNPQCYNFTSLTAATVRFNVSSFSNYSIGGAGDVTAPIVSILSPLHQNYSGRNITFNVSLDESGSACQLSLNGSGNISMTAINASFYNYVNSSVNTGYQNATFFCNDTTGNMGTGTVFFRVTINDSCTTGQECSINFDLNNCVDMSGDNIPDSCTNQTPDCPLFVGKSCDYWNAGATQGICTNNSVCTGVNIVSGEYGVGLVGGSAANFHSGNETNGCSLGTEAMICNTSSPTHAGYNPTGDGMCIDSSCMMGGAAILDCGDSLCQTSDVADAKFTSSCTPGWACDSAINGSGFFQDGICNDGAPGTCQTAGHLCNTTGTLMLNGCSGVCIEGSPCDATLTNGNFNTSYGTCTSGSCVQSGSNSAPSVTKPTFNNTAPSSNDDLKATSTYSDPDTNQGTVYFRWWRNLSNVFNETFTSVASGTVLTSNISHTNYTRTDIVNVSVYANDGQVNSETNWSINLNITNGPPTVTAPALNDSTLYAFEDLQASTVYTDQDTDLGRVVFMWYINGTNTVNQTFTGVVNNTNVTANFSHTNFSRFTTVTVWVIANDSQNRSSNASSSTLTISNHAPTQNAPVINTTFGFNTTNEDLYCYNSSTFDGDRDFVKNSFAWYKNGTLNATMPRFGGNLVLYIPFDHEEPNSIALDYARQNNGTLHNNPVWGSDGKAEGNYEFNISGYIDAGNHSSLDMSPGDAFTIEAWLNTSANSTTGETWGYIADDRVSSNSTLVESGDDSKVIKGPGNIVLFFYENANSTSNVTAVEIDPNGTIIAKKQTAYLGGGTDPNGIEVGTGVYAAVNGREVSTFQVNASGTFLNSRIDNLTLVNADALQHAEIISVGGGYFAIVNQFSGGAGNLTTVGITSGGAIDNSITDNLKLNPTGTVSYPRIYPISGTVYGIFYSGNSTIGWVDTVNIGADGLIGDTLLDHMNFSVGGCQGHTPSPIRVYGNIYAVVFDGCGNDGYIQTISIASNGTVNRTTLDTYLFEAVTGQADPEILPVAGNCFVIANHDDSNTLPDINTVMIYPNGTIHQAVIDSSKNSDFASNHPSILNLSDYVYVEANGRAIDTVRIDKEMGIYKPGAYLLYADSNKTYGRANGATLEWPTTPGWNHVAVVYNSSLSSNQLSLYVNGARVNNRSTGAIEVNSDAHSLFVGKNFNGTIDEVALFNRSLREFEINQHYQAGKWYDNVRHASSIDDSQTTTGDQWECSIQPMDFIENGTTMNSTWLRVIGSICMALSTPGTVYTLQNNITGDGNCINITASNISLDCSAYNMTFGGAGSGMGVSVGQNIANVTIKNCIIAKASNTLGVNWGIFLNRTNESYIYNNTITTDGNLSGNYGIFLQESNYLNVSGNTIRTNRNQSNYGIYALTSSFNNISGNTIFTSGFNDTNIGIYLNTNSSHSIIMSNIIHTNGTDSGYGIYVSLGDHNNISLNTIRTNGSNGANFGLYFYNSTNSVAHSNIISTNGTANNYGLYLSLSSSINATSNTITANGDGGGSNYGVYLINNQTNNNIISNTIRTNGTTNNFGIRVYDGSFNNISLNTITTNGTTAAQAIRLDNNATSNIIYGNTISAGGSTGDAFVVATGTDLYPHSNNFTANTITFAQRWDFLLNNAGVNKTAFVNQTILNYSLAGAGGTIIVENVQWGRVEFFGGLSGSGTNLSNDVRVRNNSITVNPAAGSGSFNTTANITFYNQPGYRRTGLKIARNGTTCNKTSAGYKCFNFTGLTDTIVSFNVSYFSNYSVVGSPNSAPAAPTIQYPEAGKNYSSATYLNFSSTDADSEKPLFRVYINGSLNVTTFTNVQRTAGM
ncbi:right-handed parallel beta-helix repeat-containing protein [Candidatus Woesearchaeota archaeon]|nr:right-handed parallel beta-helix repeat-containing protein [Candidatus Woesearchaeota archaeon]